MSLLSLRMRNDRKYITSQSYYIYISILYVVLGISTAVLETNINNIYNILKQKLFDNESSYYILSINPLFSLKLT